MKNIYLVGFMGSGKTTVGLILSKRLKLDFIEMDSVIEEKEKMTICEIFDGRGEEAFRQLESQLLEEISKKDNLVVSCGGGLICNQNNLKLLRHSGVVFCLRACAREIYNRTKSQTQRPLLKVDNPMEKIEELLLSRQTSYEQADFMIETDNIYPEQISENIIRIIDLGNK